MRLNSFLRPRLFLPVGGALALAGYLFGHAAPVQKQDDSVVWVYYTSLCAQAGDASDCKEVAQPERRAFPTLEACSAYRTQDLDRAANPRLLGSCLRQHEA